MPTYTITLLPVDCKTLHKIKNKLKTIGKFVWCVLFVMAYAYVHFAVWNIINLTGVELQREMYGDSYTQGVGVLLLICLVIIDIIISCLLLLKYGYEINVKWCKKGGL
jgi:hypothetical protein